MTPPACLECNDGKVPVPSRNSNGPPGATAIELEKTAQSLAALDGAVALPGGTVGWKRDAVPQSLVRPFLMKMSHVLAERVAEGRFAQEDQVIQALLLY